MEGLESIILVLDTILNTKRKRHITGGILLSISLLFSGLSITVMTIDYSTVKNKEIYDE